MKYITMFSHYTPDMRVRIAYIRGIPISPAVLNLFHIRRRTTSGYNRLETGTRLTVLNFMANRSPSEMTRRNTVGRVAHQAQ